jgi:hypothetical protein
MKLYNIYQEIILEEIAKEFILTEDVMGDLKKAMSDKYNIWIKYKEEDGTVTDRYLQVYDLGNSKGGNEMISAYQLGGKTNMSKKSSKPYGWKQFLLDKIVSNSIKPVGVFYTQPVSDIKSYGAGPKYNKNGNKNIVGGITGAFRNNE